MANFKFKKEKTKYKTMNYLILLEVYLLKSTKIK